MTQQPKRICILGGGFGGLHTALRLSQLPWETQLGHADIETLPPEIVLVDQRDRFLFSPLLYELVTGELQTWEIAPSYSELLANTGVRFRQAAVIGLDLQAKTVQFQDEADLPYDKLVLALGGESPLDLVPGAAEYALPFRVLADAQRLEAALRVLEASPAEKIRVAVVGAGYSGVELACKLADRLQGRGRLRLIEQGCQILRSAPEFNREAAQRALSQRQVWVDLETTIAAIAGDEISLTHQGQTDTIPVDLVLWTVGTKMHPVIQTLPVQKNQRGQLLIASTLQLPDYPDLFALGDMADCRDAEGQQVPATAQVAFQQADYAGWNLWASLTGRPLLPFRYLHLGEMMTLGTDNATFAGLGVTLDGPMAHLVRRLLYLARLPTLDHQLKVGFSWITRPLVDALRQ